MGQPRARPLIGPQAEPAQETGRKGAELIRCRWPAYRRAHYLPGGAHHHIVDVCERPSPIKRPCTAVCPDYFI